MVVMPRSLRRAVAQGVSLPPTIMQLRPRVEAEMKVPEFSSRIRILPWIGDKYSQGGPHWKGGPTRKRLLILGESHYAGSTEGLLADQKNRCLTRDVIKRQWTGKSYSYHTKVAGAVSSLEPHEVDKQAFWSTVSFYSFVQDVVGIGPRVRPSDEQWTRGLNLLPEVIDALQPHYVLATGWTLWTHLPDWKPDRKLPFRAKKAEPFDTCVHQTPTGHAFRAAYIKHPSAPRFGSGVSWHPFVRMFLALPLPDAAQARRKKVGA